MAKISKDFHSANKITIFFVDSSIFFTSYLEMAGYMSSPKLSSVLSSDDTDGAISSSS